MPRSPRPTRFSLVADDFAMTPGISRSILDLLGRERLSGTGVMTTSGYWRDFAPVLRDFEGHADLGLHLNLTLGKPLGRLSIAGGGDGLPAFGDLARAAFTRKLDTEALQGEVLRQVEAFDRHFGRLPDFIDGHQHVHVLPGVRRALVGAIAIAWRGAKRPWVRNPYDTPGAILARGVAVPKALVIAGLSAFWGRQLAGRGIPSNDGFAGVSPFDPARSFAADFTRFLAVPGPRHLVMCHPGHVDDALRTLDPVVETRPQEHAFLSGEAFPQACAEAGLILGRFAAL